MTKRALITGITGQDGAYLAQLLLAKGYAVTGAYRRTSSVNFWRIEELGIASHPQLHLVEFDLTDPGAIVRLVQRVQPDEVYNLAAQSFVGVSFEQPATTGQITVNPAFYRPAEVDLLIGDPSRARTELGWQAHTTLEQLCQMMVAADLRRNAAGVSF